MTSWYLENVYTVTGNTKKFSTEEFAPLNAGLQYHERVIRRVDMHEILNSPVTS
jgi:hypothetical protein